MSAGGRVYLWLANNFYASSYLQTYLYYNIFFDIFFLHQQ